jgi:DNA invertase Pin-like site-specific DNA recombinase
MDSTIMENSMKRAVGYVRVSTKNSEQATSPAIQRTMIEQECERQGWDLVRVFEDRFSGENLDRPDFRELTAYLDANQIDLLIVKDLSRFGRETLDYLQFTRRYLDPRGIELYVLQGANGKERGIELVRLLDMWIAEDFRITNKRKVKEAVDMCASKGYWTGGIPYGYYSSKRDTGRGPCILKPDADLAPIARQIFAWSADGLSAQAIARRLNLQGIPGPKGAEWGRATVGRLLRSKVYLGMINYRGKCLPGEHEGLVDEATWKRAQSGQEPGKVTRVPGRYLLSRLYCPLFNHSNGSPLSFYGMTVKGTRRYCLDQRDSTGESAIHLMQPDVAFPRTFDADYLESAVLGCFSAPLTDDKLPVWWLEIQQQSTADVEHDADELNKLRLELRTLGKERTKAKERFYKALDYGIEAEAKELAAHSQLLDQRIGEAEAEAAKLAGRIEVQKESPLMPRPLVQQLNVIRILCDKGDRAALREALRIIINRILLTLDADGKPVMQIELRSDTYATPHSL